jgi:type IV pilus assembly protein PilB
MAVLQEQKKKEQAENAPGVAGGVPSINLTGKSIPADVLREIPEEAAVFYQLIPFEKSGNKLKVGLVNPGDIQAQEALRFIVLRTEMVPEIYAISLRDFQETVKQYRDLKQEVNKALVELKKELVREETVKTKRVAENDDDENLIEAPISKIVAVMLRYAQEGRASDIHIEPYEKDVKVRYRVDGVLHTSLVLPKSIHQSVISRIKILSNLKIDETRVPQDGRFRVEINKKFIDFRVSILPITHGETAVLRVLDPNIGLMTFDDLGLVGHNMKVLNSAIGQPFGMILITGPTGSGKTTTLYAILKILNQEGVNIISLEDPVEYYIEGVNQSQVKPEIGYTFASGLRSILRQDPDIILVGEIRDSETAGLAVHAALTGHLLLSTLHTNDAVGVIPRMIDMGVESFLIPSSLNLAIAQRLVRRLCEKCKTSYEPKGKLLEFLEREVSQIPPEILEAFNIKKPYKLNKKVGCQFCGHKGTQGRIAIFELFSMTKELEKIILESMTEVNILKEANRQGMISMKQDGIIKALQGVVGIEEVLKTVEDDNISLDDLTE